MITHLSRKQREILERRNFILDIASELLQTQGYAGLSMDRVAEASEYSKGTIYQHFGCKEELLCALCLRALSIQSHMFMRVADFQGHSREKILAVRIAHELFVQLYPREFSNLSMIKSYSFRDKITEESQNELQTIEQSCMQCISKIVAEAVEKGDLELKDVTPQELVFGLWSISYGSLILQSSDIPLDKMGIPQPADVIRKHTNRLLDGYNWKPLTHEWDYQTSYTRILSELFSEELAMLENSTQTTANIAG